MTEIFTRANEHRGASFVEVYQNCNVFNDGAFDTILNKDARPDMLINLRHGEPIRFGADLEMGVVANEFGEAKIVRVDDVGEDRILVHDETRRDPSLAFALSRLAEHPETPTPVGVFRAVDRPSYEVEMQRQLVAAAERSGPGELSKLLRSAPDLDRQLEPGADPPGQCDSSQRDEGRSDRQNFRNTIPERGLGVKNVVFCGMRTRFVAAARVLADRDRAAEDRRARGALVDLRGDRARVVPVAPRRLGQPRRDERLHDRGVGRGDRGILVGECLGAEVRLGHREREARPRRRSRCRARRPCGLVALRSRRPSTRPHR